MKRRTFLLGMCAACCGTTRHEPMTTSKSNRPPMPAPETPGAGVKDMKMFASQLRASPIAFHGDMLVQSVGGELVAWDAATMRRTSTWALPHRHFCFAQEGTLIAFGFPRGGPESAVHRIAGGKSTTAKGPILPSGGTNVVLPGRSPDELVVSAGDHIYVLRARGGAFEVETMFDHPHPTAANRDQLIALGEGRTVAMNQGSGVRLLALDPESTAAYPTPDRRLMHVAAATRGRIWYSFATTAEDWNAHRLVLAPVDTPMSDERTVDFAPGRIVHLASHGSAAAALVITLGATKATWSVVVIDESGKERWRADVPDDGSAHGALNRAFIALGDRRAVLASHDGKLLAWDASTGGPLR